MLVTDHLETCWHGRIDQEDADMSRRLHQQLSFTELPSHFDGDPVFLGFACDEGVRRNQGRAGAQAGPTALRQALANVACSTDARLFDAGDIVCDSDNLEAAQQALAEQIDGLLQQDGRPFVLGGGREMAWGSFLGIQAFLARQNTQTRVGILNFDAHFNLYRPKPDGHSGTPFRQVQQWCEAKQVPFDYFVCGINPSENTDALYELAFEHGVQWVEDLDCHWGNLSNLESQLSDWLAPLDALYVSVCLDVFPAADAPGVSAPAGIGVPPALVLKLLQFIQDRCENSNTPILLADVAELNPAFDQDGRTAKLAARMLYQLLF